MKKFIIFHSALAICENRFCYHAEFIRLDAKQWWKMRIVEQRSCTQIKLACQERAFNGYFAQKFPGIFS